MSGIIGFRSLKVAQTVRLLARSSQKLKIPAINCINVRPVATTSHRCKSKKENGTLDLGSIVDPVEVRPCEDPNAINVGAQIAGELQKGELVILLNKFYREKEIKNLARHNGLTDDMFHKAYVSFRNFCVKSTALPTELHIKLSDILQGSGHVHDIYPYFLQHALEIYPHVDCVDDLRKVSDMRLPANWYPEARSIQRKIIFHAGPTNSGKTYHALQRLKESPSGVYCGPLRMLASEVFNKLNAEGTECDLITGEERRMVRSDEEPSSHVACTVEMTSVTVPYDVAVIDEIQMLRDPLRGWAWTRALLGVNAHEVHLCGEASAIEYVRDLAASIGDEFDLQTYKRLTKLKVLNQPVETLEQVKPGDCIVCFSKNDIYRVSRELETLGIEVAVIYGSLPPTTKLAQAKKFNDPSNPCKVLVATDAVGMGLNLNIKRIIFYSLTKLSVNAKGEKEMDFIEPSQVLQIAGRAGRYGTQYSDGEVTTLKSADLPKLVELLQTPIDPIQQAGLHPTAKEIEIFAYHMPKATLSKIMEIFINLCQVDNDLYFMCNVEDFKYLADMIEHIQMDLRDRYVFCCAPIPKKQPFVCAMFLKFARRHSLGEPITVEYLSRIMNWPIQYPKVISDMEKLEAAFDVLDVYLWLSYRFPETFPHVYQVREMQKELDSVIQGGVRDITRLLSRSRRRRITEVPDETS